MSRPGAKVEAEIVAFADDVRTALGDAVVSLVLHGSAAGTDWVPDRSDINTALVVPRVDVQILERLAAPVARWRERHFALPVVMDEEYLVRARDTFPMELDDIRRQHRVLVGRDVFVALELDPAAIRRECEHEARGKLLRLRRLFLETARQPPAIEQLMVESFKSFLVVLRHLLHLSGVDCGHAYADALAGGEQALGPLPTLRRLLAHRTGDGVLEPEALRAEFGAYLADVERIVAAVDALGA